MKMINIKRIKLLCVIIGIGLTISLIILFAYNTLLIPLLKSKIDDIPDFYKKEIYKFIAERELEHETRKYLYELVEKLEHSPVHGNSENTEDNLLIKQITDYVRVILIILCILSAISAGILVKWYTSNAEHMIIDERKFEEKKGK